MSKLLFLLVLNLVAAMLEDNKGSQSQTNPTFTQEIPDSSQTTYVPSMEETPDNSSLEEAYLFSNLDAELFNNSNYKIQFIVDENRQLICAKVTFLVDPRDNVCHCAYHTAKRDVKYCKNNVTPTFRKLTEKTVKSDEIRDVSCGPKDREGSMYSFGYQACDVDNAHSERMGIPLPLPRQENSDFFEVYKFCHSKKDNKVIYTEHMIHDPNYLTAEPLKIQREQDAEYNMMTNGFEYFDSLYETIAKEYKKLRFIKFWKMGNAFVSMTLEAFREAKSVVEAQQLVPVDDMAFTLTRRPTYHFLNIAPMRLEPIILWNYISHLIRDDARKNNRKFSINTGAFIINPKEKKESIEVVAIEEVDSEEEDTNEIEEADIDEVDIWIKMIRYEEPAPTSKEKGQVRSLAIVMNTGLDKAGFEKFNHELCEENLCENAFATYEFFSETHDSVRCCSTKKIAEMFFDKELGTESSFKIEGFTEPKKNSVVSEVKYLEEIIFFPKLM